MTNQAVASGSEQPTRRRPRLWRIVGPAAAIALLGAVAVALAFEPRLSELGVPGFVERFNVLRAGGALGFGLAGAFILHRRPPNRVGWLLLAIGAAHAVSLLLSSYGLAGIHDPEAGLPLDGWAMWVSEWTWSPAYWFTLTLLPLVFPTGRLPSSRWWPAVAGVVLASVLTSVGWALLPPRENDVPGLFPPGYESPGPMSSSAANAALGLGLFTGIATSLACLVALVLRYRRASGEQRQQIRWMVLAALLVPALLLPGVVLSPAPLGPALVGLAMLPLPAAIAVAVVHHRLWDIDVVLSRSLVFAVLTVTVLAVYGATVLLLGQLLGARTGAPLVATALVAVGIQPVHQWVRRLVNRFVYGSRDDPAEALRRFGHQLDGAGEPSGVLDGVARSIASALRVPHVAISTAGAPVARWEGRVGDLERVPLTHRGVELGELVVAAHPGDRLRPRDRVALAQLAPHVGVVLEAQRLAADLERSHQRLLAVRDEERARLRRELHDGLGPMLAALALEVDRGRLVTGAGADETAGPLLDRLSQHIREAVRAVRAIVDDLRPPALDELGLAGALEALGARFSWQLDVTVDASLPEPLPPAVELAAYRIAAEAVTNAARHSGGSRCRVVLGGGPQLEVRIEDDGRGMGCGAGEGVGLPSMRRRAAELGGECIIGPTPGGGTAVVARLPLLEEPERDTQPV